jgi:chitinase
VYIGFAFADGTVKDYCFSGCPNDKVRIAMDQHRDGCKGDGGKSMCCSANYVTEKKRSYTDSESRLESEVKAFMENPDCGSDAYNFKRDLGHKREADLENQAAHGLIRLGFKTTM